MAPLVLITFVIVALQDSRKVFSFLLTNWLRIPWFFSRGRTRLAFSFFLTYNFFFFPRAVIRDTFISCSRRGFYRLFLFFLVNIYIYIYIYTRLNMWYWRMFFFFFFFFLFFVLFCFVFFCLQNLILIMK